MNPHSVPNCALQIATQVFAPPLTGMSFKVCGNLFRGISPECNSQRNHAPAPREAMAPIRCEEVRVQ